MTRIRITIDYTPKLGDYPGCRTKRDAMDVDVEATEQGVIAIEELINFADDIRYEVTDEGFDE